MSALYAALCDLARAYEETHRERDQAREDLALYLKSLSANRTDEAQAIAQRYKLAGHDPLLVSIGLEAAASGADPVLAVEIYLEDEQ